MQTQSEKGNAPEVAATEASSVKNQLVKEGINMPNSTALIIGGTAVRQVGDLYSLNDLHKESGSEERHQPYEFLRIEQTKALVAELSKSGDSRNYLDTKRGRHGGTYACKELVIAYAAWINAAFHLKVIRVFLAKMASAIVERSSDVSLIPFSVQPGQTVTEEQAAFLRSMLTESVKKLPQPKQAAAMIKGWSKLKAHFNTDYRHIPAHEFHEAVNILARHVAEWEVVDDEPSRTTSLDDAMRLQHAFTVAAQTAAKVQQAVFSGVMAGNEDWKHSRYLVNLGVVGCDGDIAVQAKQVASNACVLPINRFHDAIEDSMTVDVQTLTQLASVCMARLGQMAQRAVPASAKAIGVAA